MSGPMIATKVEILSTSGHNRAPASGYATFSDGRHFGFSIAPDTGDLTFSTFEARPTRHGLRLLRREEALRTALASGQNVEHVVIKVSLGDARA